MAKGRVTIIDVAKLAGVGNSTVSLALRNDSRIRETTRKKIRDAADRLEYVPNQLARSLKDGQSKVLGVMLSDLHPYYTAAMEEFNDAADAAGCTLSVKFYGWNEQREHRYLTQFCESRIDGLIWMVSDRTTATFADMVKKIESSRIPVVTLGIMDEIAPSATTNEVGVSTNDAVRLGLKYLMQKGHRRIGIATATKVEGLRGELHRNRFAQVRRAMRELGIEPRPLDIYETSDNEYGGVIVAGELAHKTSADRPTALFAADDMLARSIIAGLCSHGVSVPHDMSILGYDDAPGDSEGLVPLTSVSLSIRETGRSAIELLLSLIKSSPKQMPQQHILVPPQVVERSSVGIARV